MSELNFNRFARIGVVSAVASIAAMGYISHQEAVSLQKNADQKAIYGSAPGSASSYDHETAQSYGAITAACEYGSSILILGSIAAETRRLYKSRHKEHDDLHLVRPD